MVLAESPDAEPRDDASPVAASRVFNCTQCKSKFNHQAHLKRHQKSHRAEKPFSCLYCKLSSSRKDVITRHTRNFHPDKMRTPTYRDSVPERLSVLRFPAVWKAPLGKPNPQVFDISAKDRVHERAVSGT
ncbi:hypothetical protein FOVSG1_013635 [Fusarium oxysporum f. sp. vasinfectum]